MADRFTVTKVAEYAGEAVYKTVCNTCGGHAFSDQFYTEQDVLDFEAEHAHDSEENCMAIDNDRLNKINRERDSLAHELLGYVDACLDNQEMDDDGSLRISATHVEALRAYIVKSAALTDEFNAIFDSEES